DEAPLPFVPGAPYDRIAPCGGGRRSLAHVHGTDPPGPFPDVRRLPGQHAPGRRILEDTAICIASPRDVRGHVDHRLHARLFGLLAEGYVECDADGPHRMASAVFSFEKRPAANDEPAYLAVGANYPVL